MSQLQHVKHSCLYHGSVPCEYRWWLCNDLFGAHRQEHNMTHDPWPIIAHILTYNKLHCIAKLGVSHINYVNVQPPFQICVPWIWYDCICYDTHPMPYDMMIMMTQRDSTSHHRYGSASSVYHWVSITLIDTHHIVHLIARLHPHSCPPHYMSCDIIPFSTHILIFQ